MHAAALLPPLLASVLAAGEVYHLAPDGRDDADGRSREQALAGFAVALARMQPGDTLLVHDGVYRQTIALTATSRGLPDQPLRIVAAPGAEPVITGAVPVDGWEEVGDGVWRRRDWPHRSQQVFLDPDHGPPLQQIGSAGGMMDKHIPRRGTGPADLVAHSFHLDVDARVLHIRLAPSDHPDRHRIEAGALPALMTVADGAEHLEFHGLTFRHGNSAVREMWGWAVQAPPRSRFVDCTFAWNDYGALRVADGVEVLGCAFLDNGAMGADTGPSGGWLFRNCRFLRNNHRRYGADHAGAFKAIPDAWGTVEDCEFGWNHGSAVWFDYCRTGRPSLVQRNWIHNNWGGFDEAGIKLEGSKAVTARENVLFRNGRNGVTLFGSDDCAVERNTIVGSLGQAAIHLGGVPRQRLTIRGNRFTGNIIADTDATFDVLWQPDAADVGDNSFTGNLLWRPAGRLQLSAGATYLGNFGPTFIALQPWEAQLGLSGNRLGDPGFAGGDGQAAFAPRAGGPGDALGALKAGTHTPKPAATMPVGAWLDDLLPEGAVPFMARPWIAEDPVRYLHWSTVDPASGRRCLVLSARQRPARMGFSGARVPLTVQPGGSISIDLRLDAERPATSVILEFHAVDGGWGHRVLLGHEALPELIPRHTPGTALAPGVWTTLHLPAATLGLTGPCDGFAVWALGGEVAVDRLTTLPADG